MFREVVVYFLIVGHTGNIVDQKFSLIAQELKKSEVKTVEELINIITQSMTPTPEVESLKFTWDWKSFVEKHLETPKMRNHSFYNGFKISKEGSVTKLRMKRFPQDLEWLPPTGIQLLKENIKYEPVGSSGFRVESLNLDKILHDLEKYFKRMPTPVRVSVSNSWYRLKEALEGTPRMMHNLPTMKLNDLPKISPQAEPSLPEQYEFIDESPENLPKIEGKVCEDGLFDENIKLGVDVVVYTESTVGRPWVGRVQKIYEQHKKFVIRWYNRAGKTNKFRAMVKDDGTPYLSVLENSTVMYWDISVERTENAFHLTPYWISKVMKEYQKCDLKRK